VPIASTRRACRTIAGRVALAGTAAGVGALLVAATGAATPPTGAVTITSRGGVTRRGQFAPIAATAPIGWWCRISATGPRPLTIAGIVGAPDGTLASGWLVPRRTALGTWTIGVACGPTIAAVRAGDVVVARQRVTIRAAVPPSRIAPALVDLRTPVGYQSGTVAAGTGVVLAGSGIVLTNNHVIAGGTGVTAVDVGNRRRYARVRVVGIDIAADLAVLQILGARNLRRVPFGDSGRVVRGSTVSVVGNAGGAGGRPTIATGIVTGLAQAVTAYDAGAGRAEHLTGLIATSARVAAGDSGGALVDTAGGVVGIVTARSTGGHATGYAIPFTQALGVARRILAGRPAPDLALGAAAYSAYLGIQIVAGSPRGARIARVLAGSPAARAHLRAGQTIVALNTAPNAPAPGQPHAIPTPAALSALLGRLHPGARVGLTVVGPGSAVTPVTVTLGTGAAR
jgi:S1-C subfamily serine protease